MRTRKKTLATILRSAQPRLACVARMSGFADHSYQISWLRFEVYTWPRRVVYWRDLVENVVEIKIGGIDRLVRLFT